MSEIASTNDPQVQQLKQEKFLVWAFWNLDISAEVLIVLVPSKPCLTSFSSFLEWALHLPLPLHVAAFLLCLCLYVTFFLGVCVQVILG